MKQVNHDPVFPDQSVFHTPEIQTSQADLTIHWWQAEPATMAQGLDHIWPSRNPDIIIVGKEMVSHLIRPVATIRHRIQKGNLMHVSKAINAPCRSDTSRAIPIHFGVPEP